MWYAASIKKFNATQQLLNGDEKSWPSFLSLLAAPAPSGLSFGEVTADTMLVTWKAPQVPKSSDIERYIIRYHPVDDDDDTIERTVDGNANYVVLRRT